MNRDLASFLLTGLVTACVAPALPAQPAPPPPWSPRASSDTLVLRSKAGDRVILRPPRVVEFRHVDRHSLRDSTDELGLLLASGALLEVGATTPAGEYAISGNRRLVLGPVGYPRDFTIHGAPERRVFFRIESTARVGVLLIPRADSLPERSEIAALYMSGLQSLHALGRLPAEGHVIRFEYPVDWYDRYTAYVTIPDGIAEPLRIVWLAFGGAGSNPPPPAPIVTERLTLEELLRSRPRRSPLEAPTRALLDETLTVIGTAVVVPGASGSLRAQSGSE